MAYKKRIADELLKEWIESTGCVLVEGSKWCLCSAYRVLKTIILLKTMSKLCHGTNLTER